MNSLEDVERWLKEHSINNYIILKDLTITVNGNVNLNGKLKRKSLPVKFRDVEGYFDISNNNLEKLEGCPSRVTKDFNCSFNNLESLYGAPKKVGDFNCSHNVLTSLSYGPKEVFGYYNCSNNHISLVKGSPRTIKGYFDCSYNAIDSLKGGPKYIEGYFNCSENVLDDLMGGPINVEGDYICGNNQLKSLDSVADKITGDLFTDIRLNHLHSSFNERTKIWKYKASDVVAHIYKPIVALIDKQDISTWLQRHDVRNFTILPNNSVNVKGNVKLNGKLANLSKLPLSFNEIQGNFDISDNELITLEGSPKIVNGDFLAFKNELISLKGGPKEVGGNFIVLRNNISSLQYSPSMVKEDFICSHNPLKELDGLNTVQGSLFTGVCIPNVKSQKYVYNSVATYKYAGDLIMQYLDKVYVSLTDEEKTFEKVRLNLNNAISKMIDSSELKKEMITDSLLKNLNKYHLTELKEKVLQIKNPIRVQKKEELSENDILKMAFEEEI